MPFGVVLKSSGTVAAWGANYYGGETNVPAGLSNITAIAAGANHTLALKSDGTVVAWGGNWAGQAEVPSGLAGVTAIAAGASHSLADWTWSAWRRRPSQAELPRDG